MINFQHKVSILPVMLCSSKTVTIVKLKGKMKESKEGLLRAGGRYDYFLKAVFMKSLLFILKKNYL